MTWLLVSSSGARRVSCAVEAQKRESEAAFVAVAVAVVLLAAGLVVEQLPVAALVAVLCWSAVTARIGMMLLAGPRLSIARSTGTEQALVVVGKGCSGTGMAGSQRLPEISILRIDYWACWHTVVRLRVHLDPGREMMRWMLFTRVGDDGVLDLRTWSFPNALGPLGVSFRFSIYALQRNRTRAAYCGSNRSSYDLSRPVNI